MSKSEIIIYKAESSVEGLADKISKGTVISYEMPLLSCKNDDSMRKSLVSLSPKCDKSIAGINDSDLYYTKSVLVSTVWNKNDDVFDGKETWAARHTPTHKPTNVGHDETKIVGHITDCIAINKEGELIPDNTPVEDLPGVYHLVNGAVIYQGLSDEDLLARASTLIEQIEKGEKYVSMECGFTGFDYAVDQADGSFKVIARDENSAHLTKHLRAYGGTGLFENAKIGRLLRNITFIGKGYVDRPANPDSIIFNETNIFDLKSKAKENTNILDNGVLIDRDQNNGDITMANENTDLQKTVDELMASLAAAQLENKALADKLAGIDTEKTQSKIVDLEAKLLEANTQATTHKTSSEELQTKLSDLQAKVDEMTKAQLIAGRLSLLTEGGIDKEVAQKKVDLYLNLSDEQFNDIAADLTEAAKKAKETCAKPPKEGCKSDEDEGTNADEKELESAKVEDEVNLSVAGETETEVDETADTRKELQKIMASRLNIELAE